MPNIGDISVRLLLEVVDANKNAKQYSTTLKQVDVDTGKLTKSTKDLSSQTVAYGDRVANAYLRVEGFKSVLSTLSSTFGQLISDYFAQEVALSKLENGLKNVGEGAGALKTLTQQSQILQSTTTFGDEQIQNAQAMLTTFKKNSKEIEILTPRILDLAAAFQTSGESGMDLQQVAVMLGKVNEDTIGTLKRVGVAFSKEEEEKLKSTKGTEQAIVLAEILDQNFKGMAETVGNTAAGQVQKFKNSVGDMRESLGKVLADGLLPFLQAFSPLVNELAGASEPVKRLAVGVLALGAAFVVLGTSMGGIPYIIGGIITVLYALNGTTSITIESLKKMGEETLRTQEVSSNMKTLLEQLKISADNTADAYERISGSLYGMSKAQLDNAKKSIEAELFRVRGQQLTFTSNQPDNPAEFMKGQGEFAANIDKLQSLLGEVTRLMNSAPSDSPVTKTSGTTTKAKENIKDFISYLAELEKKLIEINNAISRQSKSESEAQGLFLQKKDLENLIDYVKNLDEYKKVRSDIITLESSQNRGIPEVILDDETSFRIMLQKQREEQQHLQLVAQEYDKIVSSLQSASQLVSAIADKFEKGGKSWLYYMQATLQVAIQIAKLTQKANTSEGIGIGDILGTIGTILPFFLADGGAVPGSGSGDTVPAMLTPGEYVINKSSASRLGAGFLNFLNGGGQVLPAVSSGSSQGGGTVIINLSGQLTDHLRWDIVNRGSAINNLKVSRSRFES